MVSVRDMHKPLNARHREFVRHYVAGETAGNATASYLKAYPDSSHEAATVSASRLLGSANVRNAIDELLEQARHLTVEEIRSWHDYLPEMKVRLLNLARCWRLKKPAISAELPPGGPRYSELDRKANLGDSRTPL